MPAPTIVSINDATSTAHVFRPISIGEMSTLINTESATNGGNRSMVLGYSFANARRRTDKIQTRLNLPKEVTSAEGVVSVVSTARFIGEFIIPDDWTEAERADMYALVASLTGSTIVQSYVESRDPFYG